MTVRVWLDHVVLWVEDPLRSIAFYQDVVGLPGERVEEFRAGAAPFPSIRVSPDSLIDLMPTALAPTLNAAPGSRDSAGHRVNHVCLAFDRAGFDALRRRLEAAGVTPVSELTSSFGAHGLAPHTFYFADPDGNVLEARYYE